MERMKNLLTLIVVVALVSLITVRCAGRAELGNTDDSVSRAVEMLPESYRVDVRAALQKAGENQAELLAVIESAKKECVGIKEKTKSADKKDYPQKTSKLCNWGRGQCDFYELCFGKMSAEEFWKKYGL